MSIPPLVVTSQPTTPTGELVDLLAAKLTAAIHAARAQRRLGWFEYHSLLTLGAWVVRIAIELVLASYAPGAADIFDRYSPEIFSVSAEWLHPFFQLLGRVLHQPHSSYDPSVLAVLPVSPPARQFLRRTA